MREKLSKIKDLLVLGVTFEIQIILTLILFNVDIWGYIWNIGKINIAIVFLYGWLWFVDFYLTNYSAAAVMEKRMRYEQGTFPEKPTKVTAPKKVKEELPKVVEQTPPVEEEVEVKPTKFEFEDTNLFNLSSEKDRGE